MTPAAPRRTVECQSCHAVLGTINRGDPHAPQGIVSRIITAEREVRVFVDLVMGEAGFLCPSCGAVGRTVRADRIRGIILHISETDVAPC